MISLADPIRELVKDPLTQVVLEHEQRLRSLEVYFHVGVAVASAGVTILGAILAVLIMRL
jgi:hypothetical protein